MIKPHIKCDAKNTQLQPQFRACSHFGRSAIHRGVRKGSDGGENRKEKDKKPLAECKTGREGKKSFYGQTRALFVFY